MVSGRKKMMKTVLQQWSARVEPVWCVVGAAPLAAPPLLSMQQAAWAERVAQ